jgi:hypothetical protein
MISNCHHPELIIDIDSNMEGSFDHLRVMTGEVITSPVTGRVLYTAARFGYGHSDTPERPMVRSTAGPIRYSEFHWLSRNRPRSWQVRPSERNDR